MLSVSEKTVDLKLYEIAATFFGYARPTPYRLKSPKSPEPNFRIVTYTLSYYNLDSYKLVKF
jgi:hypothetical protein